MFKSEFYDEFSCVGSECPYTCCGGWCIIIDEKTLKSYRKMGGQIAKFAKKKVVLQKGDGALSHTCTVYPREWGTSFDTKEQYLSLGCPRVVQFLFQMEGKLSFVLEPDENMHTEDILLLNDALMINLKVRETVADFLQRDE